MRTPLMSVRLTTLAGAAGTHDGRHRFRAVTHAKGGRYMARSPLAWSNVRRSLGLAV